MTEKRKRGRPKTTGKTPLRSIRVSDTEWAAWRAKAESQNLTITEWLRKLAQKGVEHP